MIRNDYIHMLNDYIHIYMIQHFMIHYRLLYIYRLF